MPEQGEHQSETENWHLRREGPFVAVSVATAGLSRELEAERQPLAGNMSELYAQPDQPDLGPEERAVEARRRANRFLESFHLEPDHTVIMRPQRDYTQPLQTFDADAGFQPGENGDDATWVEERADLIFTRDPDKVLGCRPADCPVMVGEGIDGTGQKILFEEHLAWGALNAGYTEQGLDFLRSQGVDPKSLKIYLAPGARPESFQYHNPVNPFEGGRLHVTHPNRDELFINLRTGPNKDGETEYFWDVDPYGFLKARLKEAGIKDWQIYEDDTDTASPKSGHSSNTRSKNADDTETRDLVIATMKPGASSISYS